MVALPLTRGRKDELGRVPHLGMKCVILLQTAGNVSIKTKYTEKRLVHDIL